LNSKKPTGWEYEQYTVRKVRKWDGEGAFAETRGNDGVAPMD